MPKMKNFNKTGHEPARRIQTSIRSIACIFRLQPEAPHPIRRTGRPRLSDTTNDDVRAPDKRTIPRGSRFSTYHTTGIATSRRIDAGRRNRRRIVPHVTSALMKDKHYLYRVAVTCYVDSLFYETGNARRCHDRCHSLITQTLCGIGKSTCRNYLRYDRSELLAEVRIPPALKELLHLYVLLVTKCPQTQTAALLQELRRLLEIALRHAGRQGSELTADSLIEWLHKEPKDPFPQK